MALIIDPDYLHLNTEVSIDTTAKTIRLNKVGNLSDDGVTLQALYSFLKEVQPVTPSLKRHPFPLRAITENQFLLIRGQNFEDYTTRKLIRSAGWAVNPSGNTITEEWACIYTIGPIETTEQVYYITDPSGPVINFEQSGNINEPIQVYGDATHGNIDIRSYLKLFVRTQGQIYDSAGLNDIDVTSLTYKMYKFPLRTKKDPYIHFSESDLTGNPYDGMSIRFYDTTPYVKTINSVDYTFNVVIDANGGNKYQIYHWVLSQLRKNANINADGTPVHIGKITDVLVEFSIDNLITLLTSYGPVIIENFDYRDINDIAFTDSSGNIIRYPFVAVLTINFNDNLQNDSSSYFIVFFKNDEAGDNSGRNFDTDDAIIVNDISNVPMEGYVNGRDKVQFEYDYDGNIQRGVNSAGKDAPIVVVGIGYGLAKYVMAEGTIARTTTNEVFLSAETEYWYQNP